jgi:antitoxin ParD1/3/4
MNVSLTPELDQFVAAKVSSGRYTSASEVVREALRLLEETETARHSRLTAFNHELEARLVSLDSGVRLDPADVFKRLEQRSKSAEVERNKRLTVSAAAELNLNAIWDYIADDSLDAADRWIITLTEAFDRLARSSNLGHMRQDLISTPVRFWQEARDIPAFLQRDP